MARSPRWGPGARALGSVPRQAIGVVVERCLRSAQHSRGPEEVYRGSGKGWSLKIDYIGPEMFYLFKAGRCGSGKRLTFGGTFYKVPADGAFSQKVAYVGGQLRVSMRGKFSDDGASVSGVAKARAKWVNSGIKCSRKINYTATRRPGEQVGG